jgi:hypothetical protein
MLDVFFPNRLNRRQVLECGGIDAALGASVAFRRLPAVFRPHCEIESGVTATALQDTTVKTPFSLQVQQFVQIGEIRIKPSFSGSDTVWWGEATDEPARTRQSVSLHFRPLCLCVKNPCLSVSIRG